MIKNHLCNHELLKLFLRLFFLGLNNCEIFKVHIKESEKDQNGNPKIGLIFDVPKGYEKKNIKFLIAHHNQFWLFDSKINELWNPLQDPSIKNGILEI